MVNRLSSGASAFAVAGHGYLLSSSDEAEDKASRKIGDNASSQ